MDARAFYDGLGYDYDLMVSWKDRLGREAAFFDRMLQEAGAASVLDAACGTGMHAAMFAGKGLRTAAADLSPEMVAMAKQNAKVADVQVDVRAAAFGELSKVFTDTFDLVVCLGNSLPHLLDDQALDSALADFARVLTPSGMLVIQNRNYDRVLRDSSRFMPLAARADGVEETLFLRITDFPRESSETVDFTIVTLKKRNGVWTQSPRSTTLRALRRKTLERALGRCGFGRVRVWGGYDMSPFDEGLSADLLVAATRADLTR
ncbi:MAG TPA: class I SAM-dependent methyltransferase [Spirochaetia bacterium]|nr:class I SAM-dependent methyltransferase [Spirochaetia bacterium]